MERVGVWCRGLAAASPPRTTVTCMGMGLRWRAGRRRVRFFFCVCFSCVFVGFVGVGFFCVCFVVIVLVYGVFFVRFRLVFVLFFCCCCSFVINDDI